MHVDTSDFVCVCVCVCVCVPSLDHGVTFCNACRCSLALDALCFSMISTDDLATFRVRGALILKPGREPAVSLSQNQLSEEDRTKLKVRLRV